LEKTCQQQHQQNTELTKTGDLITFEATVRVGGVAEWFKVLDLKSGCPFFKSTLRLSGFVLGSPEFKSVTPLCEKATGQPSGFLRFMFYLKYLFI